MEVLADCFIFHGIPTHIRSDNGPEFINKELIMWYKQLGVNTSFIEPGIPSTLSCVMNSRIYNYLLH